MPLSQAEIQQLFRDGDQAASPSEKGDKLVAIAKLLFAAVPGVKFVKEKIVNHQGSVEIDLAFFNFGVESGFFEFESMILVECKNWQAPVDAKAIRDFAGKLDRKRRKYGFLLCAGGVTGNQAEVTAGRDEIRHQFERHGIHILAFSRAEMEALTSGAEFVDAAREKIAEIIFSA